MITYNSIVSTDFNKQIKFVYQICVLTYGKFWRKYKGSNEKFSFPKEEIECIIKIVLSIYFIGTGLKVIKLPIW